MADEAPGSPQQTDTADAPARRRWILPAVAAAVVVALVAGGALWYRDDRSPVEQMLAEHPFYVAHRGGGADSPEMSLAGYRKAVANGADGLELSLARTSDGVWFGLHDPTLDRTSGTQGFVASQHTWAEVRQHQISAQGVRTSAGTRSPQPYMTLEQLIHAFGGSHVIFVDPKAVDHRYYRELLDVLDRSVDDPTSTFVAKSYYDNDDWAQAARARGYTTWGYYYAKDIDGHPGVLRTTERDWDLLGLDVQAPAATWKQVLAYGKPVIAHVVTNEAEAQTALRRGAQGLMVSTLTLVPH